MNKTRIPNYLDSLSCEEDHDAKPICMHGVGDILREIHVVLRTSMKGNLVRFVESLLNNSYRGYQNWFQNKRPIPVIKAKKLASFLYSGTNELDKDELWERFYKKSTGFSVDSGKLVFLPKIMGPDMAYLVGALFGDGCLYSHTENKLGKKSRYRIQITDESKEYLQNIVLPKFQYVFGIKSAVLIKGKGNWYTLVVHSKVLYLFLKNVIKMPVGKKKGKLLIPELIKQSPAITKAFLRGLFDTDGWISSTSVVKPSIGLSQSDDCFLKNVKDILSKFEIFVGGPYASGSNKGRELRSYNPQIIRKFGRMIGFEHPLKKKRLSYFIHI